MHKSRYCSPPNTASWERVMYTFKNIHAYPQLDIWLGEEKDEMLTLQSSNWVLEVDWLLGQWNTPITLFFIKLPRTLTSWPPRDSITGWHFNQMKSFQNSHNIHVTFPISHLIAYVLLYLFLKQIKLKPSIGSSNSPQTKKITLKKRDHFYL